MVAPPAGLSATARAYVEAALDTMQHHSINKYKIDWPTFRAAAIARAGTAQLPVDTYAALTQTVAALGDGHSGFFPPSNSVAATRVGVQAADLPPTPATIPSGRMLDARIAYVFVPQFAGSNPTGRVDSTLAVVRRLDAEGAANGDPAGPCGWVIDLRLNLGGNMYPMVAGVGPILGEGHAGVFVDADDNRQDWYYRAGAAGIAVNGTEYPFATASTPYTLRRAAPPVAVLYGPLTASSGEATAISFRGRPSARSFGTPTYGVSTANTPYRLSDGAILNLTTAVQGDRTGRLYGGPVPPDEVTAGVTPDPTSTAVDAGMQAAMQWLAAQPACAGAAHSRERHA